MMKFCSNCGYELKSVNNFCSNCGLKVSNENKIDNSVEFIKRNINSIKNEIEESNTIKDLKLGSKFLINKTINLVINILGLIGLITILAQIFVYIVFGNSFLFQEAYIKYYHNDYNYYNKLDNFVNFIAEILPSTIFPFLFMFLSGRKKQWMLFVSIILLFLTLILSLNGNGVSRFKKSNLYNDSILTNQNILDSANNDTILPNKIYIEDNNDLSKDTIFSDYFEFNSKKYKYKFICDQELYGECKLSITENSKLVFSQNIKNSAGLITNIKFEESYLYFESELGGGSIGNYSIYYSVIDLKELKLYQLERYCPDGYSTDCKFENIDEIKKSDKIYNYLKRKITAADISL